MLRIQGQRDVQVWIAGNEIANFTPQTEEAKQRVIHTAAKIKNASIQELVRRVLAVGKLCRLLVKRISTANRHPWRNSRRWSKLQAETGSNIERCIVLRYDCRCRSHASVGQSDKFNLTVKRGLVRMKKAVPIVRFQIDVAGNLRRARWLKTARLVRTPPSDSVTSCFWARTGCAPRHRPRNNKKTLEQKRAAVVMQNCLMVVLIEQVGRRTLIGGPNCRKTDETVRSPESYRIAQESLTTRVPSSTRMSKRTIDYACVLLLVSDGSNASGT